MNRRDMLASTAVVLSSAGSISAVGVAGAQQSPEIDQVREASTALYTSLSSLDVGRVEGFWAHESYVRYIGPTSKAVAVGWDEVKKAIDAGNAALSARRVVLTQAHIQIDGRLAWEVGIRNDATDAEKWGGAKHGEFRHQRIREQEWGVADGYASCERSAEVRFVKSELAASFEAPRRALGQAAIRAAPTGRTHDRTRLHQRQKALVNQAPAVLAGCTVTSIPLTEPTGELARGVGEYNADNRKPALGAGI